MKETAAMLDKFEVAYERHVISAHRMPGELQKFGKQAQKDGYGVIIAGAGGAAHLPGMLAANTILPVVGVPIESHALHGLDSLLSIVQMPSGVTVATTAIGQAGAKNAALLAIEILAVTESRLARKMIEFRQKQTQEAQNSEKQW
ncbi:5-(carboxyamino)imidazole ribonucleotide mutase [Pediococcus acidilactici]|uniref:5-(carboxyamino)imidazole ribonucleotide mutase n=1 Tax=Pediococcus acidilactici TaxID=1254 RepID=UPI001330E00B|nr:5-(carboxyamino)imidazole ribonucleotide mutase [Pediococcus acidilactici]KAF0355855.1 5-(carboxyamino)imidazole ribonucleotide mutase [Pediococcus acidilactici]KAF0360294.1 5-(carboxyamino)imidazole ribonucleotide mutase [Pediococcus acidilactici]KAF0449472.1 5-(carboxyamino)imidazole ribonucleotide mutase [Pediococcus acidilactici]